MEKYRKYRVILAFVSLICIIYIYYLKINDEIQIEITQNNSHIHILDQGQLHTHKNQKITLLFRTEKCIL